VEAAPHSPPRLGNRLRIEARGGLGGEGVVDWDLHLPAALNLNPFLQKENSLSPRRPISLPAQPMLWPPNENPEQRRVRFCRITKSGFTHTRR